MSKTFLAVLLFSYAGLTAWIVMLYMAESREEHALWSAPTRAEIPFVASGKFCGLREHFPAVFTRNCVNRLNAVCFDLLPDSMDTQGGVITAAAVGNHKVEQTLAEIPVGWNIRVRGRYKRLSYTMMTARETAGVFLVDSVEVVTVAEES